MFLESFKLDRVMVIDCFLLGFDHTLCPLGLGCGEALSVELLDLGTVEPFEVLSFCRFRELGGNCLFHMPFSS